MVAITTALVVLPWHHGETNNCTWHVVHTSGGWKFIREELTRKLHYILETFNCHCQDDFVENLVNKFIIVNILFVKTKGTESCRYIEIAFDILTHFEYDWLAKIFFFFFS